MPSVSHVPRPMVPWPGHRYPLGATHDTAATNFALWAPSAERVDLCLFDDNGGETQYTLANRTFGVWHGTLPGVPAGTRYGFRVHGPWDPPSGRRFNPAKLLTDPYARALDGDLVAHPAIFGHRRAAVDSPDDDPGIRDGRDSAPYVPKSVVVAAEPFDWGTDTPPGVPWDETVLYEAHVRGLTMRHPEVPEHLRGTYAGLAHPAVIDHIARLGATSVELMPVLHYVTEPDLRQHGNVNYWGYNPLGFFAPHAAYSSSGSRGQQVVEFKSMVRALHEAGLEVILDVVYNHTAEQGASGPTLSLRGIAGDVYYHLDPDDPARHCDYTGTGNTVRTDHPSTLRLVMDSLRYWVGVMHVDGFRFDLAPALARSGGDVDLSGPLMTAIHQDPVLRDVKLIAEPWDVGPDGYRAGEFPPPWAEWNDRYRDTIRDHWHGRAGGVHDLADRLAGSSDLFAAGDRRPFTSINFVTSHDGFTMRDLVSYDHKHNHGNGEDNRDGTDDNRSWNHGAEGIEADADPAVHELRQRQIRNFMATLLLSTGVPMLSSGDEMGRTQRGNNNAYCADDPTSWVDWASRTQWADLLAFVRRLLRLRAEHPVLRQRHFFEGTPAHEDGLKDIAWFAPTGAEMTDDDWRDNGRRSLGMFLNGAAIRSRGAHGEPVVDDSFLVWLHSGADELDVTLPDSRWGRRHEIVLDSAGERAQGELHDAGHRITLASRSTLLLRVMGVGSVAL